MSGPVGEPDLEDSSEPSTRAVGDGVLLLESRATDVRGLPVRRGLPTRGRRTVGPWCFVDHAGPLLLDSDRRPDIGPHPHIGLHTVTWMLEGEMLHRDSLGSEQLVRPGELNVMTAGAGVAHSEEATSPDRRMIQLLQLWVAQPDSTRRGAAAFEHHSQLPRLELTGGEATVFIGTLAAVTSPARSESALVGADLSLRQGATCLPLERGFEHGLLVTEGAVRLGNTVATPGTLAYLLPGRDEIDLQVTERARAILVGGAPFAEELFMWWNFVARSRAEVELAYADWRDDTGRFGQVLSPLKRIEAPPPHWLGRP